MAITTDAYSTLSKETGNLLGDGYSHLILSSLHNMQHFLCWKVKVNLEGLGMQGSSPPWLGGLWLRAPSILFRSKCLMQVPFLGLVGGRVHHVHHMHRYTLTSSVVCLPAQRKEHVWVENSQEQSSARTESKVWRQHAMLCQARVLTSSLLILNRPFLSHLLLYFFHPPPLLFHDYYLPIHFGLSSSLPRWTTNFYILFVIGHTVLLQPCTFGVSEPIAKVILIMRLRWYYRYSHSVTLSFAWFPFPKGPSRNYLWSLDISHVIFP